MLFASDKSHNPVDLTGVLPLLELSRATARPEASLVDARQTGVSGRRRVVFSRRPRSPKAGRFSPGLSMQLAIQLALRLCRTTCRTALSSQLSRLLGTSLNCIVALYPGRCRGAVRSAQDADADATALICLCLCLCFLLEVLGGLSCLISPHLDQSLPGQVRVQTRTTVTSH